jgi:hypothetical protein
MKVKEAIEKLEQCDPDAELKVDPPYSDVLSIYKRSDENVVEISH